MSSNVRLPSKCRQRRRAVKAARMEVDCHTAVFDLVDSEDYNLAHLWTDQPSQTMATPTHPPPGNNSNTVNKICATRTAPPKQNPSRLGLFDLAAELRILIYTAINASLVETYAKPKRPDDDLGIINTQFQTNKKWTAYRAALRALRLTGRAFSEEFMPVWAATTTFQLPTIKYMYLHHPLYNAPHRVYDMWDMLRQFIRQMGPELTPHLLDVRLVVEHIDFCRPTRGHAEGLLPLTGQMLTALLERCSDVKPNFRWLVTFWNHPACQHRQGTAKRTIVLRQTTEGCRDSEDGGGWVCENVGPIMMQHSEDGRRAKADWKPLVDEQK